MEQLPLGLIPGGSYASKRVIYSPRDLFLMVTDGITEVANARDEEFGLTRLQELLTRHAARALPEIGISSCKRCDNMACRRMTKVCSCCAWWTRRPLPRPEFQRGAGNPKPQLDAQ